MRNVAERGAGQDRDTDGAQCQADQAVSSDWRLQSGSIEYCNQQR